MRKKETSTGLPFKTHALSFRTAPAAPGALLVTGATLLIFRTSSLTVNGLYKSRQRILAPNDPQLTHVCMLVPLLSIMPQNLEGEHD
jgi:hypothetical protein